MKMLSGLLLTWLGLLLIYPEADSFGVQEALGIPALWAGGLIQGWAFKK